MKSNIYLIALVLMLMGTSCKKDFLERKPLDQIVNSNYYQSSAEVLMGTAPLYNIIWHSYNDKAVHGLGDGRAGVFYSGGYMTEFQRFLVSPTSADMANSWRCFYNVVGQANTVIKNIETYASPSVPREIINHALGEARFMRGLAYWYLVENWQAVPVIADNSTLLTDTTISRNTVESVWEFILRDFRFAANNLLEKPTQKGRLTKYAGEAMLARMFLTHAGVGTDGTRRQTDLDSAAYYCRSVLANSGARLMENYEDLFLTANNNNEESLFALQWVYNGVWGTNNTLQAQLAFSSSITGFADGWGAGHGAGIYILQMYDLARDKRRKATFMFPGDVYRDISQAVPDPANPSNTIIQPLVVPTNPSNPAAAKASTAYIKKYVVGRPEDNNGKVAYMRTENNTYMLRLAEVYLTLAEALLGNAASTTDKEAVKAFNKVHERAGLDAVTEITWEDIFKERYLEFAMEGLAWYDFVRLHYYNPQKAYEMLNTMNKGTYTITPLPKDNPVTWNIEVVTPRNYPVNSTSFFLPYPAGEVTKAPNLLKPPVPYQF
ncbi:RagB/SusD family nutrient uptake outer membrane protein [Desertivirga xinjiangensis]|uniref:RagB/SusD family nutrient uptake outer membrane protein n=1 Tax=Desertivirga xinjiangensis TaxID=539206 RepID=UPI00210990C0|nr:RagB/SusD family nutrient uptake outer membrane protein [Pedobacter xinjiangensis]